MLRQNAARFLMISWLMGLTFARATGADMPSAAGVEFFETKIRPVLVEHCYKCHSDQIKTPKGNLRLDTREAMSTGGDSGPAVVPGKP
ncbi:MAG: c-type cytochrome domain-containing protein, partial [Isosphaeraceae bacterium]